MAGSEPPDGGLSVGQRIGILETAVLNVGNRLDRTDSRIDGIESWRDQLTGRLDVVQALVKWVLGTSLLGTLIAIVTLVLLVTGANPK